MELTAIESPPMTRRSLAALLLAPLAKLLPKPEPEYVATLYITPTTTAARWLIANLGFSCGCNIPAWSDASRTVCACGRSAVVLSDEDPWKPRPGVISERIDFTETHVYADAADMVEYREPRWTVLS